MSRLASLSFMSNHSSAPRVIPISRVCHVKIDLLNENAAVASIVLYTRGKTEKRNKEDYRRKASKLDLPARVSLL
ncbi:hypothetical protein CSUI_009419 [Cystoisospora suis]|uniref:Uncharacterized protein n=1 Tax=Cystoisospora suis TaxID=483139 RepID=A0A2C6KJV2_9APIC|nr:hypothetical protein CSUI_009419 [Cystoisospora suis]